VSTTTTAIIPRWEWRTFGATLGSAEARLPDTAAETVEDSDEIYVLSLRADESVKIRADLMDVKHRQDVRRDGLELWKPVLKGAFPLAADGARTMLEALGVNLSLERSTYSLDQLLDELVAPCPDLHAVHVHKHRAHHSVSGAMVELTVITCDDRRAHTIAVESPDPAQIIAAIEALGLTARRNVCVARGLKALIGFGTRFFAAVDVGTNSVKMHVGARGADGGWSRVADRAEVTRLGEGLDASGALAAPAMARTADAIATLADEARHDGACDIAVVGTAALRVASNRATFVDEVRARTGLEIEVISGDDEARLAYLAAVATLPVPPGTLVAFDSGGGSTQFTFGQSADVAERFSVDVGAVRVAERFGLDGAVDPDALHDARAGIATQLGTLHGRPPPDALIGMGGTITNLAAVRHGLARYDPDVVHGTVLDVDELDRQIELYRTRDADGRRAIVGLQPSRAEVILAGACIVRTILELLGHGAVTVSDRGLRHGLLVERFALTPA
jgi:exopolyphosphatase/guanosine-5'-triphosphate,3'-diphosphate pyrophosphatase